MDRKSILKRLSSLSDEDKQLLIGLVYGELTTSSDFSKLIGEASLEVINGGPVTKENGEGTLKVTASSISSYDLSFDGYITGDYTFWGTGKNVEGSQVISAKVRVEAEESMNLVKGDVFSFVYDKHENPDLGPVISYTLNGKDAGTGDM